MDEMKYALLADVLGRWKADIIENLLKEEGIDVVVVQETVSDLFTSTYSPVKIYVSKEDMKRARELLKTFNESKDEA